MSDRFTCGVVQLGKPRLGIFHDDLDGKQVIDGQLEESGFRDKRRCGRNERLCERGSRHFTEAVNIEPPARSDVFDSPAHLGGATLLIGAPKVDVALFCRCEFRSALWTVIGHDPVALCAGAQFNNCTENLGDDITRLAEDDRVAEFHPLRHDDVLVVERRLPNNRASHANRLHHGIWCCATGATNSDNNVEKFGVHLFRRVFVCDRPPRCARGGPQRHVGSEGIHFDDDAVDLVFKRMSSRIVMFDEFENLGIRLDDSPVRRRGHSPRLEQFVDLALVGNGRVVPRANSVNVQTQTTESIDHRFTLHISLRISFLSKAPRCRVAGIRKLFLTGRNLPSIERLKLCGFEEHFSANLHHGRDARPRQPLRNSGNVGDVLGDVFSDNTVTTGCRLNEESVLVSHVECEPVDLDLAQPLNLSAGVAPDAGQPRGEFVVGKDVVETVHALAVRNRIKQSGLGGSTDLLSRAVLALNLRERPFELS